MERSIRFRLTVWYAFALLAALGLFSGLLWLSLRQRLMSEVDRDLADRAARLQAYVTKEAGELPPVELTDELEEFCQALPPTDRVELQAPGFSFHYPHPTSSAPDHTRTVRKQFPIGRDIFRLEIAGSLDAIDHTLDLVGVLLLSLVPLVVLVACAGGAWMSGRALKPVDEMTSAVRTIGIDNLSLRLRTPQTGDELQRLAEVWNTMLERLEGAVKTLSQFAADASHELRTPLAVIRTSAELALRRAREPETYRASLAEIAEEADRMTQLVEDLLFLARGDSRAIELPMERIEPRVLVAQVCGELLGIADAKGIRIRQDGEASGIRANPPALRRLFLVLLDNAVKYSKPGAEVIVRVEDHEAAVAITVEDFGIGIGETELPHIFRRFYQADKARTDGGFGLGLSLADSIAKAHGARIEVASEVGAGSRFSVYFQAMDRNQATERAMPSSSDTLGVKPKSRTAAPVGNS